MSEISIPNICKVAGCSRQVHGHGFCRTHYKQEVYHGRLRPLSIEERLLERTVREGDCWIWKGSTWGKGYGRISLNGKEVSTHRLSYEMAYGPIPKGKLVCHACDNPPCLNPAHLWVGTQADNLRDMDRKGRRVTPDRRGEANGRATLTEAQVREIRRLRREADLTAVQIGVVLRIKPGPVDAVLRDTWRNVM